MVRFLPPCGACNRLPSSYNLRFSSRLIFAISEVFATAGSCNCAGLTFINFSCRNRSASSALLFFSSHDNGSDTVISSPSSSNKPSEILSAVLAVAAAKIFSNSFESIVGLTGTSFIDARYKPRRISLLSSATLFRMISWTLGGSYLGVKILCRHYKISHYQISLNSYYFSVEKKNTC